MRCITWNVNSVKARLPNILAWLEGLPAAERPDVMLLQELKCQTEAFPAPEFEWLGYNLAIFGQKTYNGVAILSKTRMEDVVTDFPGQPDPSQSRYIEALVPFGAGMARVASVYVPNGQEVGSDKFQYKLAFLEALQRHMQQRLTLEEPFMLGGDFNVAPTPLDVYDPKLLSGSVCYHPEEQLRYRALVNSGLTDVFRAHYPHVPAYSWWDYRAGGWAKNEGLRIDMLLASPKLADGCVAAGIDTTPRAAEKASDHAPVWAVFAP